MKRFLMSRVLCVLTAAAALSGSAAAEPERNPVRLFEYRWDGNTAARVQKECAPGNEFAVSAKDGSLLLTMREHDGKPGTGGRQIWMNTDFKAKKQCGLPGQFPGQGKRSRPAHRRSLSGGRQLESARESAECDRRSVAGVARCDLELPLDARLERPDAAAVAEFRRLSGRGRGFRRSGYG